MADSTVGTSTSTVL